ncbi:MAG: TlyA family rRNA (cytidine-2'-O)-methyltransferase [Bacillota bacterium]|nr:MAG: TlyA family rRNA (cytidine-2'-O)-methyltransferase [Bacillota bacterium]
MRLDVFLHRSGKFDSRTKAAEAIDKGFVLLNGKKAKAGAEANENSDIRILEKPRYVSNGGYKLERALDAFAFSADGKIFADIGASTGGFTDALLQRGAAKVFAVDVGEKQLHPAIAADPRVIVMDHTNARNLTKESFPCELDGIIVDCSFISLKLILPAIKVLCGNTTEIIALIKPQFECEEKISFKNGIVKDLKIRAKIVKSIYEFCIAQGFHVTGFTNAPLIEGKNVEYLIRLTLQNAKGLGEQEVLNALI